MSSECCHLFITYNLWHLWHPGEWKALGWRYEINELINSILELSTNWRLHFSSFLKFSTKNLFSRTTEKLVSVSRRLNYSAGITEANAISIDAFFVRYRRSCWFLLRHEMRSDKWPKFDQEMKLSVNRQTHFSPVLSKLNLRAIGAPKKLEPFVKFQKSALYILVNSFCMRDSFNCAVTQ